MSKKIGIVSEGVSDFWVLRHIITRYLKDQDLWVLPFYVAKDIAQATDQKVEYSKHKGLEFKKCKALLMEALEDHHTLSREEIDKLWWNLLPDTLSDKQKKAKVGNMLTKMREEGDIVNTTVGNASIWSLLKSKN